MARTKLVLLPLSATNLITVLSLILQHYGIISLCKVNEVRRNNLVLISILRKRSYILRKQRALIRKKQFYNK